VSQRPPVDRQRIEEFLRRLSQRYPRPARIYLVGGTTMVFEGFRRQTLDIDLAFEVAGENHGALIQAIRELKEELSLNVEEASPGDFIPLPKGYRERSQFVGRYGQIDVFHFDLYSTALSKIERGTEEDFSDVLLLLRSGRIDPQALEACYSDILPLMGTASLKQDPGEFRRKFDALRQMMAQPSKGIDEP
jgi:hypothetical protein